MSDSSPEPFANPPTLAELQTVVPVVRLDRKNVLWRRTGTGSGTRYEITSEKVTIGRGDEMDLRLNSTAVSRLHAMLTRHDGEYTLIDVNSLHGVLLNGVRVHSADLRDGDVIQLADVVLVYEEG